MDRSRSLRTGQVAVTTRRKCAAQVNSEYGESRTLEPVAPLVALGEQYRRFDWCAAPKHFHLHRVSRFLGAKGIGKVVKVPDGLAVKFDHNVAGLETGFSGGRSFAHIRELHSVDTFGEIGNRTEVGAV